MRWKFWQRSDGVYAERGGASRSALISRVSGLLIGIYIVIVLLLWWWWDYEPRSFAVTENAVQIAQRNSHTVVTGYTTTATVLTLGEILLNKRGGYLSNDLMPPGVWMDNVPEWEFGVVTMMRDTARVFRNDFSRSQSQSAEDPDLSQAEGKFFFDNSSWMLPQTETEYEAGLRLYRKYLARLADTSQSGAQFYARADNLEQWLATVNTRLGSLSQRLSASVGKRQLNTDLVGDTAASQSTAVPKDQVVKTPWLKIDNVFYQTRGFTWALIHLLRSLEYDFGDVLDKKNARVSMQQIVRELEPTQDTLWSPMVLNGDGLGPLANHSLVMASYIARANAAINDLRELLKQG